jgi:energy-converting hydrogenase A subunit M
MWPSVVVHEHWPVSQRMIVEMGDYAWSEHIVTVFLASQVNIKIEHVWDFIGRKINQRNPKCQNIDELRTAILQEWQQFP